jgi:hypothetical protein
MPNLVNRVELARIADVTPAAITKAAIVKFPGGVVGKLIDLNHIDVIKWLANKGDVGARMAERVLAPLPVAPVPRRGRPVSGASMAPQSGPDAQPQAALPLAQPLPAGDAALDDIERYADLTLRQLTTLFGTAIRFAEWLKARKSISDIREKDLRHDERVGRLIPREYVRTHVIAYLQTLQSRLLQDTSTTIARRCVDAVRGGMSVEEVEAMVRELLSKPIREAKAEVSRSLLQTPPAGEVEQKASA